MAKGKRYGTKRYEQLLARTSRGILNLDEKFVRLVNKKGKMLPRYEENCILVMLDVVNKILQVANAMCTVFYKNDIGEIPDEFDDIDFEANLNSETPNYNNDIESEDNTDEED